MSTKLKKVIATNLVESIHEVLAGYDNKAADKIMKNIKSAGKDLTRRFNKKMLVNGAKDASKSNKKIKAKIDKVTARKDKAVARK